MRDQQTIDLGVRQSGVQEQYSVLERLEQIAAMNGRESWSDDHEIHTLMVRYEHATRNVGSRFMRIAG